MMKASNLSIAAGTPTNPADNHVDGPCVVHAGNLLLSAINVCDCLLL